MNYLKCPSVRSVALYGGGLLTTYYLIRRYVCSNRSRRPVQKEEPTGPVGPDGRVVIEIIHNPCKTSSLSSFISYDDNVYSVCGKLAGQLQVLFRQIPDTTPIDIILHTNGGELMSGKIIIDMLNNHKGTKRVFIPEKAFSCGTLIALACDEIYMHKNAHMSPVDPQTNIAGLMSFPVQAFEKLFEVKDNADIGDWVHLINNSAFKTQDMVKEIYETSLKPKYDTDTYNRVYDNMVKGVKSHGYPFSVKELQDMGLNIRTDIPDDIMARFNRKVVH